MVSQQVLRKVSNIDDPNRFDAQNILRRYIELAPKGFEQLKDLSQLRYWLILAFIWNPF